MCQFLLHDIGTSVDHENRYVHTFYMMFQCPGQRIDPRELVICAFVGSLP